jgi:hypothetical protein
MGTWFECKIRYQKIMENGKEKKVTELYIVDALSFTEAEARIIEEVQPFMTGEFVVSDIKRVPYSELFPSNEEAADRWYKCKIVFIAIDEKSGAERRTSTHILVQASDLRDAVKKLDEEMKGTLGDYQIVSIAETMVMDVYPYSTDSSKDNNNVRDKGIIDEMSYAKKSVLKECEVNEGRQRVRETQAEIKQKAMFDVRLYLNAVIDLAESDPDARTWYLGCGALLIENNDILKQKTD